MSKGDGGGSWAAGKTGDGAGDRGACEKRMTAFGYRRRLESWNAEGGGEERRLVAQRRIRQAAAVVKWGIVNRKRRWPEDAGSRAALRGRCGCRGAGGISQLLSSVYGGSIWLKRSLGAG